MHSSKTSILMALLFVFLTIAGCGSTSEPRPAFLLTGNLQQQCLRVLREGLNSDEFWPSIHAAEALIDAGYTFEVNPILTKNLQQETDKRRIAGYARALLRAGQQQALVNLQDILLSNDREAKIIAAEAMFRTASIGDIELLQQAMGSSNGRLRIYAAAALTVTESADKLDDIRAALQSQDPAQRYIAADVIPVLGTADDDLAILEDFKDLVNSDFEQLYFTRAMAIFGQAEAREMLGTLLSHRDATIRSRATYAIAEAWLVEQSNQLIKLLDDPALAVRVNAAHALLDLSNPLSPYRYLSLR